MFCTIFMFLRRLKLDESVFKNLYKILFYYNCAIVTCAANTTTIHKYSMEPEVFFYI